LDSTVPIGGEAEAYLMTAARAEHVATVIRPALERGDVVICDRFLDSTIAYQGGGRGLPVAELHAMQRLAVGPTMPTLTFLLDLPIDVGLERRARAMDGNRIDKETRAFHLRVAEWYRSEARAHPERWVIVDATQAPDVVHTAVTGAIRTRLGADIGVRTERGLGLR
jgi:dTMP kinase